MSIDALLKEVKFDENGLVSAVAQQADTKEVLMLAWMNEEAIRQTLETGEVVYFSRSRNRLWKKGETSGQVQKLVEFQLDCDGDAILLHVEQSGVACHTGRRQCFFRTWKDGKFVENQPVLIPPQELYKK